MPTKQSGRIRSETSPWQLLSTARLHPSPAASRGFGMQVVKLALARPRFPSGRVVFKACVLRFERLDNSPEVSVVGFEFVEPGDEIDCKIESSLHTSIGRPRWVYIS